MIAIGLTGGISSGKSAVAEKLAQLGALIIDADHIAREVVAPGQPAWQEIIDNFGYAVLRTDGFLDRKKLGAIVFADAQKRRQWELITHPAILAAMRDRMDEARRNGSRIVVLDIPLLIEVEWNHLVQYIWLVYVDRATQLQRLMKRDNISCLEAEQRLAAQMSLDAKRKIADIIIDNSGTVEQMEAQVLQAWEEARYACGCSDCP